MKINNLFSLIRKVEVTVVQKGEIFIPAGSKDITVYFIRKGLARSYYIDDTGNEITFQLYAEMDGFSNVHAILLNEKSRFTYQALEKTKVYCLNYESLMAMTANNSDLLALERRFFGKRVIRQVFQRLESLVFLSPEERYQKYAKDHQHLIHRVPDKYIANVLGITPVSLSRIRSRIANKH